MMADASPPPPNRGFYDAPTGSNELLSLLYSSSHDAPGAVSASSPFELLGASAPQQGVEANAEPVEFKGIRIRDWVIGCNKTHITPVDDLDKCGSVSCVETL
jgi:hypothetical protein